MNGLLAMAEPFIDRMTNPQHGANVNEEYSLRFGQLLTGDEQFASYFTNLSLDPEDIYSLPMFAWPWYLQWRAGHARPPSPEFLDALFDATDDPSVRLSVFISALSDTVTSSDAGDSSTVLPQALDDQRQRPAAETLGIISSIWLRNRLIKIVTTRQPDSDASENIREAVELVTYLLQLGDTLSLESLAALLQIRWPGRQDLIETIEGYLTSANLDSETDQYYRSQLGLANTGNGPSGTDRPG